MSWSSTAHRRSTATVADNPPPLRPRRPGLDPAPNPRPIFQVLAFGLIVAFGLLQLRPVTHVRDPSDPFRKWVQFQPNSSSSPLTSRFIKSDEREDGMVHIVSWMETLDLRLLAVLANSTLSSSRYPDLVSFHFFIPQGNEDKVSFYKLKVLFPHSNLEIRGQEEVKERVRSAISGTHYDVSDFEEVVPFIMHDVLQSLGKFIYVSPNVIVKGKVEQLIGVDLGHHAIAAAEDCSKRLNSYFNLDVLNAIQRSAAMPWVSETPYIKSSCLPDLNVLLIDASRLEKNFIPAVLWWSKVLNLNGRTIKPVIALALYSRYLKLPASWLVKDPSSSEFNKSMAIRYARPKVVFGDSGSDATLQSDHGNFWSQFLPPLSERILSG
ncbi:hypothetical protein HS088_TW14G00381 [Tripterygium wilfordii]|uniref:Hexosyltransferase n=1 Tax=Tripterygium wilfordii TaxID=458696 RepID=A0A7J7CQ63_TRIWF|nr:uncharacterized protein LOC120014347 isoform X2 [Tripterygium wilfordii]KAF5736245.1 hypothetical protein HS088_TW14G00381 [Tripterygium wilfordii]